MSKKTAIQKLSEWFEEFYSTDVSREKFKVAIEEEKQQMIDFHIEVMKFGLIDEGELKWQEGYKPKIEKIAENYYNETYKS